MNKYFKELILWIIVLLPYLYLWLIWGSLPVQVPTHFNIQGVADDWSSRTSLLFIPGLMSPVLYVIMLIVPLIDPKGKIQAMGEKYYTLKLILTLFFTALSIYILHITQAGSMTGPNFLFVIMGGFFAAMGNYMQTVRPNYFIGIRTPWTLENEEVWKSTHRLGGKIWLIGGLLILVMALVMHNNTTSFILFMILIGIMALVPIVYSYLEFRRLKTEH